MLAGMSVPKLEGVPSGNPQMSMFRHVLEAGEFS